MLKELMMYGSEETIHIASVLMQYVYINTSENNCNYGFEMMYLTSKLICSLKKDFTGYTITPKQLMEMKIKDLYSHENSTKFEIAEIEMEKLICKK